MKRVIALFKDPYFYVIIWMVVFTVVGICLLGCALTDFYTVKFTSRSLGEFEVNIPKDVPDFTGDKWFRGSITDKYCGLMFLRPEGLYKLIINCNKPKVYALIEEIDGKIKCWLYVKDFPVPVSEDKIKDLLLGKGT